MNMLSLLKVSLKAIGVKVSHLNQNHPDSVYDNRERLQITLPLGRTIHIYVKKNQMLISSKAHLTSATYSMDITNPANDPNTIVEMFKTICEAQIKFLNKCIKLSKPLK